MYIKRRITKHLNKVLSKFPIVSLTGPRQSGKTTLLKSDFPSFKYYNLERIDYREIIQSDIMGFLKNAGSHVIFDEAQNLPELFSYIQVISDERNTAGQYILSGSQSFLLNEKISQSLAGRVSVNHLLPLDITELNLINKQSLYQTIIKGFYPRIYDKIIEPEDFYPSYLETYIERDIRALKSIENLNTFIRFLGLCAGRIGQVLNLTSLANDAGIAVNTAKAWLSLLESSFIVFLLQPYFKNFNKRLIKSPKIYFYDTGVASSLLKLTNVDSLKNHFAYGALFENLVISELIKCIIHSGKKPAVYYWRESNGLEIDCIIEKENGTLIAIEIKGGETYNNDFIKNIKKFSNDIVSENIEKFLIYTGEKSFDVMGIKIIPFNELSTIINKII
ncbi:MAG: ATP-binding protein [Ignavibacterium sp.]